MATATAVLCWCGALEAAAAHPLRPPTHQLSAAFLRAPPRPAAPPSAASSLASGLDDQLAERLGISPDAADPTGVGWRQQWFVVGDAALVLACGGVPAQMATLRPPASSPNRRLFFVPSLLPAASPAFAQQMAKLYNNLGLKMMERRKHEEALGLVRGAGLLRTPAWCCGAQGAP